MCFSNVIKLYNYCDPRSLKFTLWQQIVFQIIVQIYPHIRVCMPEIGLRAPFPYIVLSCNFALQSSCLDNERSSCDSTATMSPDSSTTDGFRVMKVCVGWYRYSSLFKFCIGMKRTCFVFSCGYGPFSRRFPWFDRFVEDFEASPWPFREFRFIFKSNYCIIRVLCPSTFTNVMFEKVRNLLGLITSSRVCVHVCAFRGWLWRLLVVGHELIAFVRSPLSRMMQDNDKTKCHEIKSYVKIYVSRHMMGNRACFEFLFQI